MFLGLLDVVGREIASDGTGYHRLYLGDKDFHLHTGRFQRSIKACNVRRIRWPEAKQTWFDVSSLALYGWSTGGDPIWRGKLTFRSPTNVLPGETVEVPANELAFEWELP